MNEADNDLAGFAPPAFNATNALVALRRQLRDFKLTERQGGALFEQSGRRIVELAISPDAPSCLQAKLVKKPALTPEWTTHRLASSADVRKFQDTVKQHLARWATDD